MIVGLEKWSEKFKIKENSILFILLYKIILLF